MTSSSGLTTSLTLRPSIGHAEAMALAAEEGRRFVTLLNSLTPEQWTAPTECSPWTVRDMSTHVLANHESLASVRELARQQLATKRRGGNRVDSLSALQIEERAELSGAEIADQLRAVVPRSIAARNSLFLRPMRPLRFKIPMRERTETWSGAYLADVIYTRDTWMHRMDICRAAGVEPQLDAAHDGRLVAGIVAEWADRHHQPYRLTLTGPAGGTFASSPAPTGDDSAYELDAVEFCRVVSGRGERHGLLAVEVGF